MTTITATRHHVAARNVRPGDFLDTHFLARVDEVLELPANDPADDRVRITYHDAAGVTFHHEPHHDDTITVIRENRP